MKKVTMFFLLMFLCLSGNVSVSKPKELITIPSIEKKLSEGEILALRVAYHESRFGSAVGDNGKAVGILQIWPIMVKEVNRVAGSAYTLEDRNDPKKSIEMFVLFQTYHNPQLKEEVALKLWNGGKKGMLNGRSNKYWNRYQRLIKSDSVKIEKIISIWSSKF